MEALVVEQAFADVAPMPLWCLDKRFSIGKIWRFLYFLNG